MQNTDIELSSWPDTTSLLSPWKISATAIQLQFVLRQMGQTKRESQGVTNAGLDKLASMIFHHTLSSEEAYFIAQMTKGVGSAVAGKVCLPLSLQRSSSHYTFSSSTTDCNV